MTDSLERSDKSGESHTSDPSDMPSTPTISTPSDMSDPADISATLEVPISDVPNLSKRSELLNSSVSLSPHNRLLPLYMGLAFLGMLAVGMIVGFLARPLIMPDRIDVVEIVATAALGQEQAVAQSATDSDSGSAKTDNNAATDSATSSASSDEPSSAGGDSSPTPTIMDFLMADARHILGADDAPVTIIEFSDFK